MFAIEFLTKIEDGVIGIPPEYWKRLREQVGSEPVKVIILAPERRLEDDAIEKFLNNPFAVPGFSPLTRDEIYARK